jgi:two-component system cell cycle sensor histidine kinase/response regulator CckA
VILIGGDSEGSTHDGAPGLAVWPGSVAHFVCDGDGLVRSWSQAAERMLGLDSSEAIGRPLGQLFPGDGPDAKTSASGANAEFSPVQTWILRDGSGPIGTFLRTMLPLPSACGERLFLWMVWPAARLAAEPAAKPGIGLDAAAAIATRVAHDFNSLLAPVLGNVILLEEETPRGDHLIQRLNGIREATEAARSFAQRLMTIDPRRKFTLEPADLGQVVRECLPALRAALHAEIAIEHRLDAAVDSVRVSRRQIEQALLQLALNAQDAMPAGGKLSLMLDMVDKAVGEDSAGRWVRLRVQDNGRGMEPALLEHAFELFVSTKVPGCGVGLGLAAVSSIVRNHGGAIDVESRPGMGTTFSIFLPSDGLPGAKREHAQATRAADAPPAPGLPDATLLLVEDNAMVRRSIENTLRGMGYVVLAVESGERCIEIVRDPSQRVDLLITDVVMPEMSGKELIERVHELRPGLAVLFMSGYDRSTLATRKQPVVIEHFLQKPFDSEDLLLALRKVFGVGLGSLAPGKK